MEEDDMKDFVKRCEVLEGAIEKIIIEGDYTDYEIAGVLTRILIVISLTNGKPRETLEVIILGLRQGLENHLTSDAKRTASEHPRTPLDL